MIETDILERAQEYVLHQLPAQGGATLDGQLLQHTQALAAVAEEIGRACALNEHQMQRLLVAAWLHELCTGKYEHESPSALKGFLKSIGLPETDIEKVRQSIAATQYPQHPRDVEEEVLCDAVTSFLASPDYLNQAEANANLPSLSKSEKLEWISQQRKLLKEHTYFTAYARQAFSKGIEANLKALKKKQKEFRNDNPELDMLWEENKKLRKSLQKEKQQKAIKGVETMFRTTMASHLQLSVIADSKANLLISINAIIASIMISSFVRKFAEVPHLLVPSILLTIVCVVTTICAVLATRPNIKRAAPPPGSTDFLFFGDYVGLGPDAYRKGMREIMQDPDRLYNGMIDNIFLQGKVLARKYRLLKLSYTVFMIGLGIVLISYAVAWIFFRQ